MNWLKKYLFERKLKSLKRKVEVANFEKAKSALLIYNICDQQREEIIQRFLDFLDKKNISAQVICYQIKKEKSTDISVNPNYLLLNKKGVSWVGQPKSDEIKKIMDKNFDLCFDFNEENTFALQYISSLSSSRFKISWAKDYQQNVCDLTFQIQQNNIKNLIEQIKSYLPMLQKNKQ